MKTWIISELFYPEEISTGYVMTKIAEKLSEENEINVICGPSNYESDVFTSTRSISNKINIHRVSVPSLDKNKLLLRVIKMLLFTTKVGWKVIRNIRREDKVILVTNPPSLLLFVSFLKKLLRFEYIIIVHDVFPENMVPAGIIKSNSFFYGILLRVFNSAYNVADKLIAVGEDMKSLVLNKVQKDMVIEVIQNWADSEEIYPLIDFDKNAYYNLNFSNKIIIQFAGNIGRVQGLDTFLEILDKVNNPNVVLIIIGEGAMKDTLMKISKTEKLENIYFLKAKPRNDQINFLNACDIGLITLSKGMYGLGVPSKVYNVLAAGKPVLFVGDKDAEISLYIKNNNSGWAFTWEDKGEIVDFLNSLNLSIIDIIKNKGKNARGLVEQSFTQEIILEKYKKILMD